MSSIKKAQEQILETQSKRRRRPPQSTENGTKRRPIRLVSSLGEGKLLDRFQSAVGEKETKKKMKVKGEKDRKSAKEKKDREMAKFQAELDALLEDTSSVQTIPKKDEKTYVPKLSGTVKGKFEALERKKREEEENKISHERERRTTRDLIEKKRIQIELAKKKQQGLLEDDDSSMEPVKPVKVPGKLNSSFEESDKRRKEHEKKKIELEKQMKLSAELREMKELHRAQEEGEEEKENDESENKFPQVKTPGKLKTNLIEMLREQEEQQRHLAEEEKRHKLEEEKQQFRLAKLAASSQESDDTMNSTSSLASSNTSSTEKIRTKPCRLSSSFTQFDVLEKQRMEEERKRLQERRKALLEEEKQLFEESRKQEEEISKSENGQAVNNPKIEDCKPGKLDDSLTKFDLITQQKFEDQRKKLSEERSKLLEEEKKHFKELKDTSNGEESSDEGSDDNQDSADGDDVSNVKIVRNKKRNKVERRPSKLDKSRLKFDVLEKERMDQERRHIQERRNLLLEEEKRLFEIAKQQEDILSSESDDNKEKAKESAPGRLDCSRTKFDIMTEQKFDEERKRIRKERDRLMVEERKLMEEEKLKLEKIEEESHQRVEDDIKVKKTRQPRRLDKSFTEFDILERRRKQEENEKLYENKARKLEEEKRLFREARERMTNRDEQDDADEDNVSSFTHKPNRLPVKLTNFDMIERERLEKERLKTQQERIKLLEEEVKMFEKQKEEYQDSDDDVTSASKELMMADKKAPRPKRLASSFTKFDLIEKQRRDDERARLQKEKAQQLEEERRMFEKSKREIPDNESEEDDAHHGRTTPLDHRSIKKMDIRGKMEAVMKAQEDAERKRIEETKFTRMTVEQQEMFLAKQRQIEFLKKQLENAETESYSDDESYADEEEEVKSESGDGSYSDQEENEEELQESSENEDEDTESQSTNSGSTQSNSSGSYSGAPYFVQTLQNLSVIEGDPVRFDSNINANPHPKVTWYFKNRLIRNSPDYQYMTKGTQYSLYMNESFVDDVGEYMCKAVNDKGVATSKAYLYVKESD